jgi:hypothetical protein
VKKIVFTAVVLLVGLTVLAGYFFQAEMSPVLAMVFEWALVLVAAAGLVGVGYLAASHVRKIIRRDRGYVYSIVLLAAFLLTTITGFVLTTDSPFYRDLILNVQIPVEASLLAILAAILLYASLRLIRTRGWTAMSIAFLASTIFSLVVNLGFLWTTSDSLGDRILSFFKRLPLVGARGVLIGMALGGLLMGLRYFFSIDRTDGES